jgi:hypothetical protein
MKKKFKIALLSVLGLLVLSSFIIYFTSPYRFHKGFSYKLIKQTVEIDAPTEKVYQFLGNSDNAAKWSVFVHHISPLNSDEVLDGAVGSIRRCFRNADEKGTQWDELTTENVQNKKRQLIIYNLKGFPMTAKNLATEQLYESLGANKCRLSFTVFFKDAKPSFWETIKTYLGSYKIKSVFKQNMTNIKNMVEAEVNAQKK